MPSANMATQCTSIAFVGAGPTTLYGLAALIARAHVGFDVTVFEEQPRLGLGTPYRPGWNDPAMLCNIASIEIPPLAESLLDWLQRQCPAELVEMGVDPDGIDDRAFVPRVVLGRYFEDQFRLLVDAARRRGVRVEILTRSRVIDVADADQGVLVTLAPGKGLLDKRLFDRVVLATGHQWPVEQEVRPGYFLSPWPASALALIPATKVGIRGSSLSAIDAAVALASRHGAFVRGAAGLVYEPALGSEEFSITMMSRKGVLPEADFYFPQTDAPLRICTPEAVAELVDQDGDLLDGVFDLFRREMMLADPAYAAETGLESATLETFCEQYFAARANADPFDWAQANLAEAQRNHAAKVTVPWRYAILRMHEVVGTITPRLDAVQFERFNRHFKPVLVDDYAAVPHESIERLLALHRAEKLQVVALGDNYRLDAGRPEGGVLLQIDGRPQHFPVFIEATGQRPLSAIQFPFLSLLEQGIVRDQANDDGPNRGIAVDDQFHPLVDGVPFKRLFCLSLPFLMGRHPFVQGITSSHEIGEIVGEVLAEDVRQRSAGSLGRAPEAA